MNFSILLLTLNEEANLPACLAAVDWCDDIVVLDSFSSDSTLAIAEAAGARVYQRRFDHFAGQRNHALEQIEFKHEWILHLDADEIVTPELYAEIGQVIAEGCFDAFRIPSKTVFFGQWLRYSGMYPTYQVRLGHRDRLRFKQVGHGQREDLPAERVGTLTEPYLHYSFSKGLTEWFDKHNRYATDEARETVAALSAGHGLDWRGFWSRDRTRRRRALKALSLRLPFRPSLRFFYMYVLRRGFLDGRAGFTYCRLLAIYEYLIVLKTRELQVGQGPGSATGPRQA
ncbi:glycosyltransferase family 2 protein [Thiohalocapsa marina]|uniref:Glycosyltransferase family 2 protein n=1 Tax=Thiohalocapsa marina TaxID=424902 RepID=A0A5M8FRL6_9GAMM|nr:glycosyltransferase family 2 protein [Thiohalocapsa marina]